METKRRVFDRALSLVVALSWALGLATPAQAEHRAPPPLSAAGVESGGTGTRMNNPAAVYCQDVMGYTYQVREGAEGAQGGVCVLPDGQACNQWDFYAGTCGHRYTYCAQRGWHTETRRDGRDPFAATYAVCVSPGGQVVGTLVQLSDLSARATQPDAGAWAVEDMRSDAPGEQTSALAPSAPSAFDWRNHQGHNWLTGVKNQLLCGSCWAFAAVGVSEAHHNILASNPDLDLNLAEQELVSCSDTGSCDGGSTSLALSYIRDDGIVDEDCLPYTSLDSACSRCVDWQDRRTFIDEKQWFLPSRAALQENVVNYGPLYASMGTGSDYGSYFDASGVYRCSKDSQNGHTGSNHAVVVVGYNDAGDYWIVRNSWGAFWNGDGYFKVGYDECNIDSTYGAYVYVAPPVTTHALAGESAGDWYTSAIVVTLSVNEAVQWTHYRLDGEAWQVYDGPFTVQEDDGIHTLEYHSQDTFGAEEIVRSVTLQLDQTAPDNPDTVEVGCDAQDDVWQRACRDPAFTWRGADDHGGSGVKDYHVYWGTDPDGLPTVWRDTADYDPGAIVDADGVAVYDLRLSTRDYLGHESAPETRFTLRYDGHAPTADPLVAGGAETVHTLEVDVEPRAQDLGSGLSAVRLSHDGDTWHSAAYVTRTTWMLQPLDRQLQTVYVQVADAVDNRSSVYALRVCLDLNPAHPASANYRLWSAGPIAAGSVEATSASYRLRSTTGQPWMGGDLGSASYRLRSGFQALWPGDPGVEMFTPYSCWHYLYLPDVLRDVGR